MRRLQMGEDYVTEPEDTLDDDEGTKFFSVACYSLFIEWSFGLSVGLSAFRLAEFMGCFCITTPTKMPLRPFTSLPPLICARLGQLCIRPCFTEA